MTAEELSQRRHFRRRQDAARAGRHLPTEEELLRGMGFFRGELTADIREYAARLLDWISKRPHPTLAALAAALDELTMEPSEHAVQSLATVLAATEGKEHAAVESGRLRCEFYLANFGDPDSMARIAGEMATLALADLHECDEVELLWRALGWSAHSRSIAQMQRNDSDRDRQTGSFWELDGLENRFRMAIEGQQLLGAAVGPSASDLESGDAETRTQEAASPGGTAVVFRSIGNETTTEGKRVLKEFGNLFWQPLPLPRMPNLTIVRARLVAEFPHATTVIDALLQKLAGRGHVHLRPTILVGRPGGGKSRFARRLLEELGLPYEMVPCGGIGDSFIGGTPRRWTTGEPSIAVMAVRRHRCAGPAIVLDEIEKVATSRHNGNVHDVLVGLLEAETASRWFDPYVEAHCDLSHVSWLMTANEVESVPAVLRDRCRILRFPQPGPDQLTVLAARILERLYVELGHDPRWATPLDPVEIDALNAAWPGGSIRTLQRLVEGLFEAREDGRARQ
ncbi:AAA family ATPase [Mesorhizobium sp. ANAO-SY3R2]|uniref:AAA family ATPase n=1 Tax=Mesorhizobium sp. ANAO-SY3R2 TaxID=3166644 RepID=UPI00366FB562